MKAEVYVTFCNQESYFELMRDIDLPFTPTKGMSLEFDRDFEEGDDNILLLEIRNVIWSMQHEQFTIICEDEDYFEASDEELERLVELHCQHGWRVEEGEAEKDEE